MKKRIMTMVIAAALVLSSAIGLSSCSDSSAVSSSDSSSSVDSSTMQDKGTLGDYYVEIVSCTVAKDWEDQPAVVIEYNFTNNSAEATSFGGALVYTIYQDGVQLMDSTFFSDDDLYNLDTEWTNIQSGKTITVWTAYTLNGESGSIDVEISEFLGTDNKKVVKSFDLAAE